LDKTNADAYFWLGQTYLELKDYDNAMENFQTSLRLNPESFNAGEGAAKAYMAKGEYNNSYIVIIKVEQYAKTDAQRARFLYIRATSLEQVNQPGPAYRDWSAILALPPEAVSDEVQKMAQVKVKELRSPTPIPPTATASRTPVPTRPPATRQPSKTPAPTATRAPVGTYTPTLSAFMEATSTSTRTPAVSATPTSTPKP